MFHQAPPTAAAKKPIPTGAGVLTRKVGGAFFFFASVLLAGHALAEGGSALTPPAGSSGDYQIKSGSRFAGKTPNVANGPVQLDSGGKVPSSLLPSTVGDMQKATYDTNADGIVDAAASANSVPASGVQPGALGSSVMTSSAAADVIRTALSAGANVTLTPTAAGIQISATGGGGGTPGGLNGQWQFNNNGAFSGASSDTFNVGNGYHGWGFGNIPSTIPRPFYFFSTETDPHIIETDNAGDSLVAGEMGTIGPVIGSVRWNPGRNIVEGDTLYNGNTQFRVNGAWTEMGEMGTTIVDATLGHETIARGIDFVRAGKSHVQRGRGVGWYPLNDVGMVGHLGFEGLTNTNPWEGGYYAFQERLNVNTSQGYAINGLGRGGWSVGAQPLVGGVFAARSPNPMWMTYNPPDLSTGTLAVSISTNVNQDTDRTSTIAFPPHYIQLWLPDGRIALPQYASAPGPLFVESDGTLDTGTVAGAGLTILAANGLVQAGTSTGTVTVGIAASGVTAGSYTNANITVNARGQITSASNGSAGGGGGGGSSLLAAYAAWPVSWYADAGGSSGYQVVISTNATVTGSGTQYVEVHAEFNNGGLLGGDSTAEFAIFRGATQINNCDNLDITTATTGTHLFSMTCIDTPTPGTYSYVLKGKFNGGSAGYAQADSTSPTGRLIVRQN